ncbi:MAG: bifunctional oligoribonuclease/PAP phosphatase NrnA [Caldilineae bacterium]|nr:bifunctional oligoribonuclease/PAP phosphatase NrnA [Chloroflexota bacterium]MCB9177456.1 bifunctional oligoribonuclease/PAP phosphatase NrnA [Caldilineae bacterium]
MPPARPTGGDWAAALRGIRQAERVWIGTHRDPDGDAIGSLLGLGLLLQEAGKLVTMACQDPPSRDSAWLPGADQITSQTASDQDLLIAVDAADADRLGRIHVPSRWAAGPSLVIDHHASNTGFGSMNLIDPGAAATAELILRLATELDIGLTRPAATCLLTGLVTDTIGFRTANTTAASLGCAAALMKAGASITEVSQQVFYRQPIDALRLTGLALERLHQAGPFATTWLSDAELNAHGASDGDMRELTRLMASAAEPSAIAVLRERADGSVDVSLRSKPGVDLGPAASALGGGGHPQASGARIDGPLDAARSRVLAALRRLLPGLENGASTGDGSP